MADSDSLVGLFDSRMDDLLAKIREMQLDPNRDTDDALTIYGQAVDSLSDVVRLMAGELDDLRH